MDLISAAGKVISLIETGIEVSDQLKAITKSEHKLPPDLANLHHNAQHLLEIIEALPSIGIGSIDDAKVGLLVDRAKKISSKVIAIMDEVNPKWQQKQKTSLTLWRSYLKKNDMESIETDFQHLKEQTKLILLELVCQSSSEAKSQYEELRRRASLDDERVIGIEGSMHKLSQRLHAVQDSIYNLGKQIGSATLNESSFYRQASQVFVLEWRLSIILSRLIKNFQEKDLKANAIAKSDPGTFDWMTQGSDYCHEYPDNLNDKERLVYDECDPDMLKHHVEASDNFRSFLQGPSGAFLILGKPASGKSTLMKYLMRNSVVLEDLEQWASNTDRNLIRAIFFFSVTQGSGALSSEESLYRSLLFQILRECPALVDEVLPGEASLSPSIPIPFEAVQDAIKYIFSNKSNLADKYCFCLFIDGLDEYRSNYSETKRGKTQNNYDISELAHHLVEWCQHETSNTKIIFSSRVIPALDARFSTKEKMLLHFHTKRDILQSAFSNFKRHPEAIPENYIELSRIICDQAQGVFLWARLVIKDILEAYTDGVDPDTFQDRIKATSTDITDLYAQILERVKEQDRQASAAILRLAAFQPAEFRLNTLACAWIDDLLKDANFPCNEPAEVYSDEKIHQYRKRAIQRLAALTHGILETQDDGQRYSSLFFFQSEIVFLHRTAQDFIRGLLMKDAEEAAGDILLPWLRGTDNVSEDDWPQSWRANLFVRVFHAEVRFGLRRADDYGKPHKDLLDFGFWAEDISLLQLSDFKTLSEFSSFAHRYWVFLTTGVPLLYRSNSPYVNVLPHPDVPRRFGLQVAICVGQDVSIWIQKRHVSRRLSSRMALSYISQYYGITQAHLDGLKWLLQTKRVCATDKRPVWPSRDERYAMDGLEKMRREDRGHVDDDCPCGDLDVAPIQKRCKWVQVWLICLHMFGTKALAAATETTTYRNDNFKDYCEMLELWLRYAATDAIILIAPKRGEDVIEFEVGKVSYVEIEQLLQLGEKPLNFQVLQSLLAKRRWVLWLTGWIMWIVRWVLCAWAYHPQFLKSTGTVPVRKRYRQASIQELSQFDWEIYGVASEDDELIGDFCYQVT
ncbi:hypothetical protein CFAM422_012957 [Trichoderma lentiforme]|uniref:NACHT domain-containing protein n=1 Tax=Trichoderma lentiforme TaxID=1567552 RepID=A0A9P5C797_9HYPO|nr:hypothetical protein CFAM422_012957 [Trichoderma lentiforme]